MLKLLPLLLLIAAHPASAAGWKSLTRKGTAEYKEGKYDSALGKFQAAGKKDPDNPTVQFNTGCAAYKLKDLDASEAAFQKAIQTENNAGAKGESFYNLGNAYYQKDQKDKAIEAYKKAILLNPKDEDARYNLAVALKKEKSSQDQQQNQSGGGGGGQGDNKQDQKNQNQGQMGQQETEAMLNAFEQEQIKQAQKMRKKRQEQNSQGEDW